MEKLTIFLSLFYVCAAFPDWLVTKIHVKSQVRNLPGNILELTNGLISRKFLIDPGFATIDYYSYEKKSSLLRAIQPEAIIKIDGEPYKIGGFEANMTRSFLNRTLLGQVAKKDTTGKLCYFYDFSVIFDHTVAAEKLHTSMKQFS